MAATGTFVIYGHFFTAALNKEIDVDSDSIKIMHATSTYSPSQDNDDYKNDVTNEVTGTNVPAGGTAAANVTVTYTGATNVVKVDHDDQVIATATASGIHTSVWYDATPATDATRPLIGYVVWSTDLSPVGGTLTITIDAAGLFTITVS
jgi:hypothetical protein